MLLCAVYGPFPRRGLVNEQLRANMGTAVFGCGAELLARPSSGDCAALARHMLYRNGTRDRPCRLRRCHVFAARGH
eukprot:4744020-Prymnesium_polylepis.1